MTSSPHEYQILLDVVRQNYASVVWTHKIQEKQSDIYAFYYKCLQIVNILAASLTSCGIIGIIFAGDKYQLILKVITAVLSFITLSITTLFKSIDLNGLSKENKDAANKFLVVRNEMLQVIADIHLQEDDVPSIEGRFSNILSKYNELCVEAPTTTDKAVAKASEALKVKKDYTFSDDEIDCFLPYSLKGRIEN